jgi:arginine/ornithine N-succinyltransferase beta subunit
MLRIERIGGGKAHAEEARGDPVPEGRLARLVDHAAICTDHAGCSEVGGLFLRADARAGGAGTLLARSRYLGADMREDLAGAVDRLGAQILQHEQEAVDAEAVGVTKLTICTDHAGCSEVGGLFLRADARAGGAGTLLGHAPH